MFMSHIYCISAQRVVRLGPHSHVIIAAFITYLLIPILLWLIGVHLWTALYWKYAAQSIDFLNAGDCA